MERVLDLVHRELITIIHEQRRQRLAYTNWQPLSLLDGSDNPSTSNNDNDRWELSEEPYENWVTNPEVQEEVSLLLNRPHLQDGQD
jgi:hypothetical protein